MVTRRVGNVEYKVAQSDRGGATKGYQLNLLKAWRDGETTSLVSRERDNLGCQIPPFPPLPPS